MLFSKRNLQGTQTNTEAENNKKGEDVREISPFT
jgi:hypothetical protein